MNGERPITRGWSCVRLGTTGLELFPVGLGAMRLSTRGRPGDFVAHAVIREALEAGVNLIDTANAYCLDDSEEGHNERLIREALKIYGTSRPLYIATKGGARRPSGEWDYYPHPMELRRACEKSLRDLDVDRIDLYQLHMPDEKVRFEDSVGELAVLKDSEKVREIGLCNVTMEQVDAAVALAPIQTVQNAFHPLRKHDLKNGLIEHCREKGLTYIAHTPLGGDVQSPTNPWKQKPEAYKQLQEIARERNCTPQVVMLSWILSKGDHVIPIPGARTASKIFDSATAASLKLTPEQLATIDAFPDVT